MNDIPPPAPEFVYAGSSDPESEVGHSKDGHTSDYWRADGDNVSLRRQDGPSFQTVHTISPASVTSDVLRGISERFSGYHTDALQKLLTALNKECEN